MIRMPLPANTSSNPAVNLLSRSRIRNLNGLARSPRLMALVPVRASPAEYVGERDVFPRDRISRQAKQRCCRPAKRCDDHRFAGLLPVALARDAAPGRAARAVHPLAAASRCLRGPLTDLPSTCGGSGMYLAPMLAGGQISRSLAHYGRRLAMPRAWPQDGFSGGGRFAWSEEPGSLNWLAA